MSIFSCCLRFSILTLVYFGCSTLAIANTKTSDPEVCQNLAKLSCAPGTFQDGTGEVRGETAISKKFLKHATDTQNFIQSSFEKLVTSQKDPYFNELAQKGLGLDLSPECNSNESQDRLNCYQKMAEGLSELVSMQVVGSFAPFVGFANGKGNFENLDLILSHHLFESKIKEAREFLKKESGNKDLESKIQNKIFPEVRDLIIKKISSFDISETDRKNLVNKIKSIKYDGTDCEEMVAGHDISSIQTQFLPNAFYDPSANRFKFCSGYLQQSTSEFQIAQVIAHELSHSIDPCVISHGPLFKYKSNTLKEMEREYPIKNILSCLRGPKSVGAKNFFEIQNSQIDSSDAVAEMAQVEHQPSQPHFCHMDQIGESFCDWLAIEIVPDYIEKNFSLTQAQYINGYANINRAICSDPKGQAHRQEGVHPDTFSRINRVILVHPKVRSQMGCNKSYQEGIYCDPKAPSMPEVDRRVNPYSPVNSPDSKKGVR